MEIGFRTNGLDDARRFREASPAFHPDTYTLRPEGPRVSTHNEPLVLVDGNDNVIGSKPKLACHVGNGLLHRGFSLLILNTERQVLMQQRASDQLLWPLRWSSSCSGHPRYCETTKEAVHRIAEQELGLSLQPRFLYKYQYRSAYHGLGTEHEICSVNIAYTGEEPSPNRLAVEKHEFMSPAQITRKLSENPAAFTPWFQMEWQSLMKNHSDLFLRDWEPWTKEMTENNVLI